MSPLIFISHSSQDRRVALRLCDALERRGLRCWLASRDIGPGENFQESIVKAIRSGRVMVLVFTGSANNSDEIKKEVALASQNRLVVIPLLVEDVMPSDAFLYELSTRQWIDAFDNFEGAVGRLADQINGVLGEQDVAPLPAAAAAEPGRHEAARPLWAMTGWARAGWLAAGLALLVAVGGLAYRFGPGSPATAGDISGTWVTPALPNSYDHNQKSTLQFDFQQSGDALLGTVSEKSASGRADKGIKGGQVRGHTVVFYTEGLTTTGSGQQPYKDTYRGTLKGGVIEFVRQNDVASGGLPQRFMAIRE
jgi:TIR domain